MTVFFVVILVFPVVYRYALEIFSGQVLGHYVFN
jgi:hypothetical protein